MDFKVTILGSNSALPAHGRNQTSQVVTLGNSFLLIDCGESTQIQLRKFRVRFSKIDYIFISHLHGDHYLGLMGLISTFHLARRIKTLTIYGPKGLDEIITVQLKYGNLNLNFPLQFIQTTSEEKNLLLEENDFRVFSFPLKHRIPCTGFIVEEKPRLRNLVKDKVQFTKIGFEAINMLRSGKDVLDERGNIKYSVKEYTHPPAPLRKYAFCSDTIYDEDIIPYIRDANLLYHESTFMNAHQTRARDTCHSTAAQAASIAIASNARQLLLGHFSTRYPDLQPLLLEAKEIFAEVSLGEEGNTYWVE